MRVLFKIRNHNMFNNLFSNEILEHIMNKTAIVLRSTYFL